MRLLIPTLALSFFLFSCRNNNVPDVSNIRINLTTKHFEKDLFSLDTNNINQALDLLIAKYPGFGENFISTILGIDPATPADSVSQYVKIFIAYNRNVYDTVQKLFRDFSPWEKQLSRSLQYVKYYFPAYKIPAKIITYIGPADGYGDILDDDVLIVGLQAHLGKDFPLYKTSMVQETYPEYVTNRFTPDYIPVNAMKNISNDLFPDKNTDKTLLVQMVEKGKRLFLLGKFLPETDEYKLIGYTDVQMKDAYAHEAIIWDLFTKNNFLQTSDNNLTKNYVSEGPKTQELGEGAPGNIGSFSGWQIVKKYMKKNASVTLDQLMKTDAEIIFANAKYKP
jgi:hypothetical protein